MDLGAPVHRLGLEEAPGLRLGHGVLVHEDALGPVDDLARLEPLGQIADLGLEALQLRVPTERNLDRGDEVALLERLHDVAHRAGVARLLDEIALRERGEDQDRGEPLARDLSGRGETVEAGHLDVEDREFGLTLADELHGFVAAAGLADDLEALLFEELLEVEADDRLVLGDDDSGAVVGRHVDPLVDAQLRG